MKKVLIGVVLVLLLPPLGVVVGLLLTFRSLESVPAEGKDLAGGARLVNDGFAAFYLLPVTGGAALVDCGDDANGAVILAELKKRSLGPENVQAIFLTHGHPDHIASCHLFPKAEVYGFAGDVGIADGSARSLGPLPRLFSTPEEKRIKVTKTLTDGESVTVGDRQVVAFAVPGHTAGSASYLSGGVLIMGDNANVGKDGSLHPAMWLFSDDPEQNHKSLRELATRLQQRGDKVEMTAYGHSGPSEGIKALVAFEP
jgi:glyoxylase-like metal-dependent hydrolase (beta-lactamase superfamily II)